MKLLASITSLLLAASCSLAAPGLKRAKGDVCWNDDLKDHDAKSIKKAWDDSIAGVTADKYINENGVAEWIRGLDKMVFKDDASPSSWDCQGYGVDCGGDILSCSNYDSHGRGGLFYLFLSVKNAYTFFDDFHERLQDTTLRQTLDIPGIVKDFVKDEPDDGVDVWSMISGSLSMAAGVSSSNPFASASFGFLSGLSTTMGGMPDGSNPSDNDYAAKLSDWIGDAFDAAIERLDEITGALFGKEGYDQSLIPAEMKTQSFDNPVVNAFGDGQWLLPHPTSGTPEIMERMYRYMKQFLGWQVLRYGRQTVVVATEVSENSCGSHNDKDQIWDPEREVCFDFYWWDNGKQLVNVPHDIADKLWANDGEYNLDRLVAYRNAYDCWVDSDGKIGKTTLNPDPTNESLPKCWFSTKVVKGEYSKVAQYGETVVKLSKFPGQKEGDWYPWAPPRFIPIGPI